MSVHVCVCSFMYIKYLAWVYAEFVRYRFQLFSRTHCSLEAKYASARVQVVQADSGFSHSDPQPDGPSFACELRYNSCLWVRDIQKEEVRTRNENQRENEMNSERWGMWMADQLLPFIIREEKRNILKTDMNDFSQNNLLLG